MPDTKTYKPDQVSVVVGGIIVNDWESLDVAFDEDKWNFKSGSAGELTRVKNSNIKGVITINIPQTTSPNLQLTAVHNSDATIPVEILDLSGLSIYSMPEASSVKHPNAPFSKNDASEREWTYGGNLISVDGGN